MHFPRQRCGKRESLAWNRSTGAEKVRSGRQNGIVCQYCRHVDEDDPGADSREMRELPPVQDKGATCPRDPVRQNPPIHQNPHCIAARLPRAVPWRTARHPRWIESNSCPWAEYGLNAPPARSGATGYPRPLRRNRARSASCGHMRPRFGDQAGGGISRKRLSSRPLSHRGLHEMRCSLTRSESRCSSFRHATLKRRRRRASESSRDGTGSKSVERL